MVNQKSHSAPRGRPRLPESEKKDRSAKRSFYMPAENYDLFFDFCGGDITRELLPMAVCWMALSGDLRESVKAASKGKTLAQAIEAVKGPLPDWLVDEALESYITALPRDQKVRLLSGQSISLPSAGSRGRKDKG